MTLAAALVASDGAFLKARGESQHVLTMVRIAFSVVGLELLRSHP